jgi:hypothetical protein
MADINPESAEEKAAEDAQKPPLELVLASRAIDALNRLAAAVEGHNLLTERALDARDAAELEREAEIKGFEAMESRRRAAWRMLQERIVQPVLERFMAEGGTELLSEIFSSIRRTEDRDEG